MASVPALLNFAFDSTNTSGCYRIATRIQGSGDPYVITAAACTPFVAPTLSVPCTAQIGITVDDETCDDVIYEGYIQPCCQEEASLDGRVPFTVTFTPNPLCKSYELTCISAGVESLTVVTPGTGYIGNKGGVETVLFVDPAGTLADAECKVEDDGVKTFTTNLPQAAVVADGTYTVAAIPSGFFDITVVGNVITAVSLTDLTVNPLATGSGYTIADPITFAGVYSALVLTVTAVYDQGEVLYCGVNSPGSGYTGPTTASIAAPNPGEVSPVLTVNHTACNPATGLGNLCDESPASVLPDIFLGTTLQICRRGSLGAIPTDLQAVAGGCCADQTCTDYELTLDPAFTGSIYYTDCTTKETDALKASIPPNVPTVLGGCFLTGSLVIGPPDQVALVTVTPVPCP
jgi:hypothetical protein